jgi:hypothetical protein
MTSMKIVVITYGDDPENSGEAFGPFVKERHVDFFIRRAERILASRNPSFYITSVSHPAVLQDHNKVAIS